MVIYGSTRISLESHRSRKPPPYAALLPETYPSESGKIMGALIGGVGRKQASRLNERVADG